MKRKGKRQFDSHWKVAVKLFLCLDRCLLHADIHPSIRRQRRVSEWVTTDGFQELAAWMNSKHTRIPLMAECNLLPRQSKGHAPPKVWMERGGFQKALKKPVWALSKKKKSYEHFWAATKCRLKLFVDRLSTFNAGNLQGRNKLLLYASGSGRCTLYTHQDAHFGSYLPGLPGFNIT